MLIQVWQIDIHQEMSGLDKQVNVQASSCKPTKKCAMKMKQKNKQEKMPHIKMLGIIYWTPVEKQYY